MSMSNWRPFLIRLALTTTVTVAFAGAARAQEPSTLEGVDRVVFLGDSITYAGQYVEFIEAYLRLHHPGLTCELLDLGLPSETVSGLSEPGHAGGAFPRPALGERLDRVLALTKPNLVVACYGMNDGIYSPFDAGRFEAFQAGMRALRAKASAAGARVVHLTPPVFDPEPIRAQTLPAGLDEYPRPFVGYDEVLGAYADWLIARRAEAWEVVDVHGPMARYLADRRVVDPTFRLADDGVHIDAAGHWLIARALLGHWGLLTPGHENSLDPDALFDSDPSGRAVLELAQAKQRVLKDAWLTATGHRRPGMKDGLPLDDAIEHAAHIDDRIEAMLSNRKNPRH